LGLTKSKISSMALVMVVFLWVLAPLPFRSFEQALRLRRFGQILMSFRAAGCACVFITGAAGGVGFATVDLARHLERR
jgi:NADPH:quinone reductase-like Zn-dependent oxidoreductase